jgi:hypothetical protein
VRPVRVKKASGVYLYGRVVEDKESKQGILRDQSFK